LTEHVIVGVGFACGCGILDALWHKYHMPDEKIGVQN